METLSKILNKWGFMICIPLLLIIGSRSCSTSTKLKQLEKHAVAMDSILIQIGQEVATIEEMKDEMQEVMLDFLITEQELDRKEITISEVKKRIEND